MKENQRVTSSWPLGKSAGICIHDNVLSPDLCQRIISFFADRPHLQFQGKVLVGIKPDVKLSTDSYINSDPAYIEDPEEYKAVVGMDTEIYTAYTEVLSDYIKNYDALLYEWESPTDSGYQYQRYSKGEGFYKPHIDGSPFSKASDRVLASVMYLNTVENGGGTHFDYFDYTCDAVVGRVLTFPATFLHLHGGLVPESDDKSILSTFVGVSK